MNDKPRNYSDQLANIMDAMAESTLEMTDEEIEAEIRDEGQDPESVAKHVRDLLLQALKGCRQRQLREAQKRYEERISSLRVKKHEIPQAPEEQRKMIFALLAANPQISSSSLLTAQFRDFENLHDEDLGSYLRQLLELMKSDTAAPSKEEDQ
jgi:hypothetical protein